MSYYRTCPDCGANLDPGEKCDCGEPVIPGLPLCDGLYIGFDFSKGKDLISLAVLRPRGRGRELINIFYGEEAEQLYRKLTNGVGLTIKPPLGPLREISHENIKAKLEGKKRC